MRQQLSLKKSSILPHILKLSLPSWPDQKTKTTSSWRRSVVWWLSWKFWDLPTIVLFYNSQYSGLYCWSLWSAWLPNLFSHASNYYSRQLIRNHVRQNKTLFCHSMGMNLKNTLKLHLGITACNYADSQEKHIFWKITGVIKNSDSNHNSKHLYKLQHV